jgi:hypothetical protein
MHVFVYWVLRKTLFTNNGKQIWWIMWYQNKCKNSSEQIVFFYSSSSHNMLWYCSPRRRPSLYIRLKRAFKSVQAWRRASNIQHVSTQCVAVYKICLPRFRSISISSGPSKKQILTRFLEVFLAIPYAFGFYHHSQWLFWNL